MKITEKIQLIDEIEAGLANRNCPLWFPELSPKLARAAWDSLRRDVGLTPHSYGTARVVAHDPTAPRTVFARLPVPWPSNGPEPHLLVELLEGPAARRYEELGLDFATGDDIAESGAVDCIGDAMSILGRVPILRDTILQLVKVIHIVRSQGDDYDVSHSDPQVPFSIFVSVPCRRLPYHSVRVAESILHEAMHLQLTLVEKAVPLVRPSDDRFWSPWKGPNRTPNGILHGLYVFRVIDEFFECLILRGVRDEDSKHQISDRRRQIASEISMLSGFEDALAITRIGRIFVTRLLNDCRLAASHSHSVHAAREFAPRRPARH